MKRIIAISCIVMFSASSVLAFNLGKTLKSVTETVNNEINKVEQNIDETDTKSEEVQSCIDEIWQDENYDKNVELAEKNDNSKSKINVAGYVLGETFVNKGEKIANISNERFLKVSEPNYFHKIEEEFFGDKFYGIESFNFYRDKRVAYGKKILLILNSKNEIGGIILNTTKKELKDYAKNIIAATKQKNIAKNIPMKYLGGNTEYNSSINSYENFKIITIEAFTTKEIKGKDILSKVGEWMLFSKVNSYVPPKIDTIYSNENFYEEELKEAQNDVNLRYKAFFNFMDKYKVGIKLEISDKETYRKEQKIGATKYDIFDVDIDNIESNIWINQKTGIIERLTIFPDKTRKWKYDYTYLFYKYYKFNYYYYLEQTNQSFEFINKGDCFIGNNNAVFLLFSSRLYYQDSFDCFLNKDICEKILKATQN